jgi:hypothetical protein
MNYAGIQIILACFQADETDVSQFDSKFTKQTPVDSPTEGSALSESANNVFYVSFRIYGDDFLVFVSSLADQYHECLIITTVPSVI